MSSASTSHVQAQPTLIRKVSQMPGNDEGSTTRSRIRVSERPSVRPSPTKSRGTRFTLSITMSTCWKKVPIQMIRNFWLSLVPAQRIVSGTKATTGI
jgi:hypothetical protein